MLRLTNGVQDYYWGSPTLIPRFLGEEPTGEPVGEQWIGTHPLLPSSVELGDGSSVPLAERVGELPFMVKLLAAAQPLSLQVHPSRAQARQGYAAEEAAGVPRDAPHRVYKDENHKPEMAYALTSMDSLIGFRPATEVLRVLAPLGTPLSERLLADLRAEPTAAGLVGRVEWLLSGAVSADEVDAVVAACRAQLERGEDVKRAYETAVEVAEHFAGDPGVVISLLLNRMTLQPGEAAFLGAGVVHAHLRGLFVEVLANSDNVLRAGLTTKHVDPDGLVTCLQSAAQEPVERLRPVETAPGTQLFAPPDVEFALAVTQVATADDDTVPLSPQRPAVVLCTGGAVTLVDAAGTALDLARGQSALLEDGDGEVAARGTGEVAYAYDPSGR